VKKTLKSSSSLITTVALAIAEDVRDLVSRSECLLIVAQMAAFLKDRKLAQDLLARAVICATEARSLDGLEHVLDSADEMRIRGLRKYKCHVEFLKRERPLKKAHRDVARPVGQQRWQVYDRITRLRKKRQWKEVARELRREAKLKDPAFTLLFDDFIPALMTDGDARKILIPALALWKDDYDHLMLGLAVRSLKDNDLNQALRFFSGIRSGDNLRWHLVGLVSDFVMNDGVFKKTRSDTNPRSKRKTS
jgi:hypothetical protein